MLAVETRLGTDVEVVDVDSEAVQSALDAETEEANAVDGDVYDGSMLVVVEGCKTHRLQDIGT